MFVGFRPALTLCAFRLGERLRSIWTLTSPVGRTVQPRDFQFSQPRPTSPPKKHRLARCTTQDWSLAHPLRLTASQPRMSLIGSIPVLQRGVAN